MREKIRILKAITTFLITLYCICLYYISKSLTPVKIYTLKFKINLFQYNFVTELTSLIVLKPDDNETEAASRAVVEPELYAEEDTMMMMHSNHRK